MYAYFHMQNMDNYNYITSIAVILVFLDMHTELMVRFIFPHMRSHIA